MMYDIAALQQMYGANYTTNSGNTVYTWSPTTGEMSINGVGQGAPGGNRIFLTVWDGGGNDTYDFSNYTTNLTVNLQPGGWTTTSTAQLANLLGDGSQCRRGNIANALLYNNDPRSLIENAIGGTGNDTIIGNVADNILNGGGGNDRLTGLAGDDTLDGGSGTDTAVFSGLRSHYAITASRGRIAASFRRQFRLAGRHGNCLEHGELPVRRQGLYGGRAVGRRYDPERAPSDRAAEPHPEWRRRREYPERWPGNDKLYGNGGSNVLNAYAGLDILDGGTGNDILDGGAGADKLIGGSGTDTASYASASGGVTADLTSAANNNGDAQGDTFSAIENLAGSASDDILVGNNWAIP